MHDQNVKNDSRSHKDVLAYQVIMLIFSTVALTIGMAACSSSSEPETNSTQVIMKLGGDDCEFYSWSGRSRTQKTQRCTESRSDNTKRPCHRQNRWDPKGQ